MVYAALELSLQWLTANLPSSTRLILSVTLLLDTRNRMSQSTLDYSDPQKCFGVPRDLVAPGGRV